MTAINYESYDRAVLASVAKFLVDLTRTADAQLTPREIVAKYNAVVPLLRLIATVKTCSPSTILDTVLTFLAQQWRAEQGRWHSEKGSANDDACHLWFWYGGLEGDILWARVKKVPVQERLYVMVELLDGLDPDWRKYVKRSWCRSGVPIVCQVFLNGEATSIHLVLKLCLRLGMSELSLSDRDWYKSVQWLALRGLIARDLRAGTGGREFDRKLALAWWEEARTGRPNRRAVRRTSPLPILARRTA